MPDPIEANARRVRKRRRNRQAGLTGLALQSAVFWTVVAIALLTAGYALYRVRLASLQYNALAAGISQQEMIYLRGHPLFTSADGAVWHYSAGAGVADFARFGADGTATSISCIALMTGAAGCPDVLGVEIGAAEDELVNRLGPPTTERYIPGGKVMSYADMGLVFSMREFRVAGITKTRRAGPIGFVPRAVWFLLP